MEKVTKKEQYAKIRAILAQDNANDELVAFIDHEVELLTKKNASRSNKPTKSATATAELAEQVLKLMEREMRYTATELVKATGNAEISNQRMTAALNVLVNTGFVKNEKVKGKSLFFLA